MKTERDFKTKRLEPYQNRQSSSASLPEKFAMALTVIWVIVSAYLLMNDKLSGDGTFAVQLFVVFMPLALLCLCLIIMRASRVMQEEAQMLQTAVDALRKAYTDQVKLQSRSISDTTIGRRLEEMSKIQHKIQNTLTIISSERVPERRKNPQLSDSKDFKTDSIDQPLLALGTSAEELSDPLSVEDFIKALNFPETADDEDGFAALRRGLKDRETALLIQAAQDVLTLLSQDGIYMDDLRPDMARPEAWRRFALGERGRKVAALGGIRDRSSLALTSGRMKQDSIFRDTAHHFLRMFDKEFSGFEKSATDAEISAFSETRTARAFMLIARVAGTFD
jgi:hypothetical protein